ncbi:MAG: DUF1254 domain-containing protein [Hyphomicrobiales bacterium]
MMRWLYWIAATGILAVVVHLGVVIFVPGVDTGQKMAELEAAGEVNMLHRLGASGDKLTPLTEPSPDLAYAFCKFDIRDRPLLIEGKIPPTYWSVSVYSETGDNVYTLNDRQAGVPSIKLMIVREGDTFEPSTSGDRPDDAIVVRTPTSTGLVLFRAFIPDRSQLDVVERHLAASKCASRSIKSAEG